MALSPEQLFRTFIDNSPSLAWMKDDQGRYVYSNAPFERLFEGSLVGRTDSDLWPSDVAKTLRENDLAVLKAGQALEFNEIIPAADGVPHAWLVLKFPFEDGTGKRYVGGTAVDITARQKAEQSLSDGIARLKAILDTAVDAIITIDERGIVESFNASAEHLFGYAAVEVIGKSINRLMPEPYRSEHDGYLGNYLHTGVKKIIGIGREVIAQRKDGTTFPIHLAVSEFRMKDRRMFTGMVRDLTELKRMQEEVVRTQSLAAIGEMSASVAHEIKNPLAAISGVMQILRKGMPQEDPRARIVDQVLTQVDRLDATVKQLLLFAKPWKPSKRPHSLRQVLDRVAALVKDHPQFARVTLKIKGDEAIEAPIDTSLIEQVLWNVMLNAAQAMPQGGEIRMVVKSDGNIEVIDSGVGMPPGVQEKLFRPFFSTKITGAGLGLSICRKIMEAHGGTIEISSRAGSGTTVRLGFASP